MGKDLLNIPKLKKEGSNYTEGFSVIESTGNPNTDEQSPIAEYVNKSCSDNGDCYSNGVCNNNSIGCHNNDACSGNKSCSGNDSCAAIKVPDE
ncbi:MAG: hypothetical protein LUE27_04185 [Clostridia bacterium]|nr:hypothetical protein [Clostridia bacterium]